MKSKKHGFTLVELAVVLIIIGVLIGGVVAGLSLKKGAQIQAVITDFGRYKSAAVSFKEKYYYWPGDMPNASSDYWSAVPDGDGNGQIGGVGSVGGCATAGNICASGESFGANRALYEAGFLTKAYTTSGTITPDVNFPKAPIDKISGMNLAAPIYVFTYTTLSSFNKNVFSITDIGSTSHQAGALQPDNGYALDQKIDDSLANSGDVRGFDNVTTTTTCLNGSSQYDVANSSSRKCIVSLALE